MPKLISYLPMPKPDVKDILFRVFLVVSIALAIVYLFVAAYDYVL